MSVVVEPTVVYIMVLSWIFGFVAGVLSGWFAGVREEAKRWYRKL